MSTVKPGDVAAFVWAYWRRRPRSLVFIFITLLAMTAFDIAMPTAAGALIDRLTQPADEAGNVSKAFAALFVMLGIGVGYHVTRAASILVWNGFAARIMHDMVLDCFAKVQRFSTDWHSNTFAGSTVRKMTRGMWAYDRLADTVYIGFLPAAIVLSGITILLFLRWPLMGIATAIAIIVFLLMSVLLATRYVSPANQRANAADSTLGASLADAITCNAVVKAFGAERREDALFKDVIGTWRGRALTSWTRMWTMTSAQSVLQLTIQLTLMSLAVWFWTQGRATPGDVTFVLTSYFLVAGYLREVGYHVQHAQQGLNELEDMVAFGAMPLGVADKPEAAELKVTDGDIAFDHVTFRYGNQNRAIYDGFSLNIRSGERVALVGPSGSGKSTFVKLVQRLYDIDGGRILIDGQDIACVTQESLRQNIALVPQDPVLFHRTLAENIAYGRPGATHDAVEEAAKRAHAEDFIHSLPQGYETLVGERGVKLSGGERQRVALARAFLADAPILILDEATSSLDSVTEAYIQDAMDELMKGRTTILIAHRLSTIRSVDRILVFDKGRIVEQGTHDQLMAHHDGRYRRLHAVQVSGFVA